MCDEWRKSYMAFRDWAKTHGYADGLELDRIDVNGGYNPGNCRWISHHEQSLNRRDTLYVCMGGHVERLFDFCTRHSINRNTVNNWRHIGVLDAKLSELFGEPVTVKQRREVI